MHNGYFYPQDIKVIKENGVRKAFVDFSLPTIWTEQAYKVAETCYLSGWEMARRAYEQEQSDQWMKKTYPRYYKERMEERAAYASGMSVTGYKIFQEEARKKSQEAKG
jgi:hypothetical protein